MFLCYWLYLLINMQLNLNSLQFTNHLEQIVIFGNQIIHRRNRTSLVISWYYLITVVCSKITFPLLTILKLDLIHNPENS
mgnify:CR=1 FL=1